MESAKEVFGANRELFGSVPAVAEEFVCPLCLGPVNPDFDSCYACTLLQAGGLPSELLSAVVPMTTALSPSPWYSRLTTYKAGNPGYHETLGALVETFVRANRRPLESVLGRAWDIVGVVPSKRGISYAQQPLRAVLSRVDFLSPFLAETASFKTGQVLRRSQYRPRSFRALPAVVGGRILLVEDTWVTGATALSTAGALLREGASAVAVLPLARLIDSGFWPESHPTAWLWRGPTDPSGHDRRATDKSPPQPSSSSRRERASRFPRSLTARRAASCCARGFDLPRSQL